MFFFDPSEFTARLQTLLPNARSIRPEDRRTQARRPQRMSYAPCKAHFRTAAQPRGAACRKDTLILAADQFSDAFFFQSLSMQSMSKNVLSRTFTMKVSQALSFETQKCEGRVASRRTAQWPGSVGQDCSPNELLPEESACFARSTSIDDGSSEVSPTKPNKHYLV